MTKESLATLIEYCPQCVVARPERPKNQDPLNLVVSVPKICPSHQAENDKLKADGKVKVRKFSPGVSGRPKEEHQKSLLNLTGPHHTKTNRSKNHPP